MLTPEEREWAFALEEALYGTDETTSLKHEGRRGRRAFQRNPNIHTTSNRMKHKDMPSDFELASHAMIGKGNTARALKRIKRLAAFKETYRVPVFAGYDDEDTTNKNNHHNNHTNTNTNKNSNHQRQHPQTDPEQNDHDHEYEYESNTIEVVLQIIKKFLLAYPDFIRSIGMDKHGRVAVVFKLKGLRWSQPPPFNHTERDRLRALYCLLYALQPTIEAVRRGTVWIGDLKGVATERPAASFLVGCRMLLRDSYPIRVEDVPVVRCPPMWSAAFVGTYPYWSRHFANKFVRVDPATLRTHFPTALLDAAKTTTKQGNGTATKPKTSSTLQKRKQQKQKHKPKTKLPTKKVVAPNTGDHYDNTWENLDDDSDDDDGDDDGDSNEWFAFDDSDDEANSDWGMMSSDGAANCLNPNHLSGVGAAMGAGGKVHNELWDKIERLVRMRFETERTFRVV